MNVGYYVSILLKAKRCNSAITLQNCEFSRNIQTCWKMGPFLERWKLVFGDLFQFLILFPSRQNNIDSKPTSKWLSNVVKTIAHSKLVIKECFTYSHSIDHLVRDIATELILEQKIAFVNKNRTRRKPFSFTKAYFGSKMQFGSKITYQRVSLLVLTYISN